MEVQDDRLLGRAAELDRVDELIEQATTGTSSALLILGEPGIGKTTLVDSARSRAATRGLAVLQMTGVEAESGIPFAGLAELLAPVLDLIDEVPPAQASALRSALAIEPGEAPAPFVVAAAVLSVLAAAVESDEGLLVAVDDAQWLDEESLAAILFITRRLHAEGVVVVIGARPEPDRGLTQRGIEQIELAGLGDEDARAVIRAAAGNQEVGDEPLRRLLETAAGNPLALVELPRALGRDALAGIEPSALPVRPGAAVERAFEQQLAGLPPETTRALVVAAADETADLDTVVAAIERLGIPADAFDAAERAETLRIDGARLRFRHPLLRSVAYHRATAGERREAHAALAAVLDDERDRSRRVLHLAEAATGPDAELANDLEDAAERARRRGAVAVAAHNLTRSTDLTPGPGDRARRLAEAARAYARAGDLAAATDLAGRGLDLDPEDRVVRANLQGVMAEIALRSGRTGEARERWMAAAESVADVVPVRSAEGWIGVAATERLVGDRVAQLRAAERAIELATAGGSDVMAAIAEGLRGSALISPGRIAEVERHVAKAEAVMLDPEAREQPVEVVASPVLALILIERFDRADRLLSMLVADARERSALTALMFCLGQRTILDTRRGRFHSAYADATEALRMAEDAQQIAHIAALAAPLAELEAATGRADECREHAQMAIGIFDFIGANEPAMMPRAALGLLELGLGRPGDALQPLGECERRAQANDPSNPNIVQWAADYIEALVRAKRTGEAEQALHWLEGPGDSTWAAAALDRCRGLLAPEDSMDEHFQASIDGFRSGGMAFEAARSQLCWGERLRRARRRVDSREVLRDAHATFARTGAAPWAARASDELRATGETLGRDTRSPGDELTPHEFRIASLVAQGRTNPEVASELFISRKTVEHHLSQIYRKIGVRSRTELAALMAGELET